jgi:hypothetical protein
MRQETISKVIKKLNKTLNTEENKGTAEDLIFHFPSLLPAHRIKTSQQTQYNYS